MGTGLRENLGQKEILTLGQVHSAVKGTKYITKCKGTVLFTHLGIERTDKIQ